MKSILLLAACFGITASASASTSHELLKHVSQAPQAHSASAGTSASTPKRLVTTQLVESEDGSLTLVLDQRCRIALVPSDIDGTWVGCFADPETQLEPGVVLEQSYDGGGTLLSFVTIGWNNPTQVVFQQQDEAVLGLVDDQKKCTCQDSSFICTKTLCDNGGLCIGAGTDTCFYKTVSGDFEFSSWSLAAPGNDVLLTLMPQTAK